MKTCTGQKTQAVGSARVYSSIANCRTKISAIYPVIFGIFAVFKMFFVFIPLLCAEPLTMFCGTVLGQLLHTVRQVLTEEELDENIGDISKKVCHNFPSKWALLETSPRKSATSFPANRRYLCSRHKI